MKYFIFILLGGMMMSHSARAQKQNGLILRLLFNGDVKDNSFAKNHGATNGGVTFGKDRFGNDCGAIELNGQDAYVTIPSSKSLESPKTALTMAAWVKINAGTANLKWVTLCCKGNSALESPNCPQYRLQGTNVTVSLNTEFTEKVNLKLDFDTWFHYALTYEGKQIELYLNGKSVFTFPYTESLISNTLPLEIGRDMPGKLEYFNGSIDDLCVYNKALTAKEINTLYQDNTEKTSVKPCAKPIVKQPVAPPIAPPAPVTPVATAPMTQPMNPPVDVDMDTTTAPISTTTLNPPFIHFQIPCPNKQTATETVLATTPVTAKVLNVTSDKQITILVNGDAQPFTYDSNKHLVTFDAALEVGENSIEIVAKNKQGQNTTFITIPRASVKALPPPVSKPIEADPSTPPITPTEADASDVPPPLLKKDKIVLTDSLTVQTDKVTIVCYDHNKIDGDVVTVLLNNATLFHEIQLLPKARKNAITTVQLTSDKTYILVVQSINEGTLPTTTLTIEVTADNGFKKMFTLNSKKGTSAALKLVYNSSISE